MKRTAVIGGGWSGIIVCKVLKEKYPDRDITFIHDTKGPAQWATEKRDGINVENYLSYIKMSHPVFAGWVKKYVNPSVNETIDSNIKYNLIKDGLMFSIPRTKSQFLWNSILFIPLNLIILLKLKKQYSVWPGMSLHNASKNIFGETFTDYITSAFSRAVLGNDAEDIEFASAFPLFYKHFAKHGKISTSLDAMKKTLAQEYPNAESITGKVWAAQEGNEILFNRILDGMRGEGLQYFEAAVKSVNNTPQGYELKTSKDNIGHFSDIIFCSDPQSTSGQLKAINEEAAEIIKKYKSSPLTSVYSVWDVKQMKVNNGGVVFPRKEKAKIYGSQFLSEILEGYFPENKTVIRSFIPGDADLFNDNDLSEMVITALRKIHKQIEKPEKFYIVRHSGGVPRYSPGFKESMKEIKDLVPPGVQFAGWFYSGYSITDQIESAKQLTLA